MPEPFGYIVLHGREDGVLASALTLREAVAGLESPDYGFGWKVVALVGTEQVEMPKWAYAEPNPPSAEEALSFIRQRAKDIAAGDRVARICGIGRCNPDDPEEQQVADYIRTAAWKVRAQPDERWWATPSPEPRDG